MYGQHNDDRMTLCMQELLWCECVRVHACTFVYRCTRIQRVCVCVKTCACKDGTMVEEEVALGSGFAGHEESFLFILTEIFLDLATCRTALPDVGDVQLGLRLRSRKVRRLVVGVGEHRFKCGSRFE